MFLSLKDRGGEDRVFTGAKGAAFLAHNSFSRISCTRVENEVFSEDPDALIHVQWETANEAILTIACWEMKLDDFLLHEYDVNSILERNYAMHLMMELTQEKCRGITDALLLEPWGCFDFLELHRLEPPVLFVGLDVLACQIFEAMDQLIEWKGLELHKSMKSATFPLRSSVFGNCTEEVIEVVGHADCARRSEGHRFIGSHHLLLGLLRTRIRRSVLKFVQLRQALEEPVRNPRYRIYDIAYTGQQSV
ncbi:unnamed protein product [Camellia sinensis]